MRTHGDFIAAPLGNQAANTLTRFLTQSHYPDTELTSPCATLIMNAEHEATSINLINHWFDSTGV